MGSVNTSGVGDESDATLGGELRGAPVVLSRQLQGEIGAGPLIADGLIATGI